MISAFFLFDMKHSAAGLLLLSFLLLTSCRDYTPRPVGYNRIDLPEKNTERYTFPQFSFDLPDYIHIDTLPSHISGQYWFNIVYPRYDAVIHCTYLNISKDILPGTIEDSYHLAYSHSLKADEIKQQLYTNKESKVSGIVYEIEGEVATPVQFFATDSLHHFLRGSFYYSAKVNTDSVVPITASVKEDIRQMISTLVWENPSK